MKRFMLSTALVALTMTPAMAQTTTETAQTGTAGGGVGVAGETFYQSAGTNDVFASDFIGKSVYVTQNEVQGIRMGRGAMGTGMPNGAGAGADTTPGVAPMDDTATTEVAPMDDTATTGVAPMDDTATTGTAPMADTGAAGTADPSVTADPALTDPAVNDPATGGSGMATTGTQGAGMTGLQDDWEDVGTVDDVVMTREGELQAVLIDVGGFLGIGARTVAVDIDALNIVEDPEANDFYVVFTSTREDLENAPEYDRDAADNQAEMGAAGTTGTVAPATGVDDTAMTGDTAATGGAVGTGAGAEMGQIPPQEGYGVADRAAISVDELTNANLYDANNDNVANVSDVIVATDGQIEAVIADVGGFLGIGTRTVALNFDELEIHRDEGGMGSDLRVYVPMSREQLEALPEYQN